MKGSRLVVIGGDAAGMSAAAKVRRQQPEREIVVFEKGQHTSYSACGIPYWVGGLIDDVDKLVARSPETFRQKCQIDVRIRHEVTAIDPKAQRLEVFDLDRRQVVVEPFDQLLIATGASPYCPDVPGGDADGVFGLSTLASGIQVHRALQQGQPQQAVIVGGGYIGLEMAEALIRRGLKVSLVQREKQVMTTLDPDMGELVSQALRDVGVTLFLEENFTGFETTGGRVRGVVTDQRQLAADIVILGMGVRPNSALAKAAGLELSVKDAIQVDSRQRTGHEQIWAAGDCVASRHRLTGQPVHIALGTIANKQGLVAGINLSGGDVEFPGVMGTAVSKICAIEVARTGLQEKELAGTGLDYAAATVETRTRAGYYPGAGKMTVKLLGEKRTGRLLGAQIVGMEGAAKRIDVIATALTAGMTAEELVGLDLSYAPPFSPVWDPVQTAARQLQNRL